VEHSAKGIASVEAMSHPKENMLLEIFCVRIASVSGKRGLLRGLNEHTQKEKASGRGARLGNVSASSPTRPRGAQPHHGNQRGGEGKGKETWLV